jgi:hypothetical protein
MSGIGIAAVVLGAGVVATVISTSATHGASPAPIDPEVLAVREAAWRAFFGGDVKTLADLLPPEFIGIGMNDGPFTGLTATLDASRAFRDRGGRLVRLAFPETDAQVFGDVVVLYGRYEVVVFSAGAERTMRGRLTELFVKRNGKWLHPGWHLDLVPGAGAP